MLCELAKSLGEDNVGDVSIEKVVAAADVTVWIPDIEFVGIKPG
jgi:hypothetical protein